jgi:hypothetical protein
MLSERKLIFSKKLHFYSEHMCGSTAARFFFLVKKSLDFFPEIFRIWFRIWHQNFNVLFCHKHWQNSCTSLNLNNFVFVAQNLLKGLENGFKKSIECTTWILDNKLFQIKIYKLLKSSNLILRSFIQLNWPFKTISVFGEMFNIDLRTKFSQVWTQQITFEVSFHCCQWRRKKRRKTS